MNAVGDKLVTNGSGTSNPRPRKGGKKDPHATVKFGSAANLKTVLTRFGEAFPSEILGISSSDIGHQWLVEWPELVGHSRRGYGFSAAPEVPVILPVSLRAAM